MTRLQALLTLSLFVFAGRPAVAQPEDQEKPVRKKAEAGQMSEDVEIMRRLLLRNLEKLQVNRCQACHHPISGVSSVGITPEGELVEKTAPMAGTRDLWKAAWKDRQNDFATLGAWLQRAFPQHGPMQISVRGEGTYLPGQGVIFMMTLPNLAQVVPLRQAPAASKPISDWEEMQRQLRGEKPEKRIEPTPMLSLTDLLQKTLADNGNHFSQLKQNEALTVIVTFRDADVKSPMKPTTAGSLLMSNQPRSYAPVGSVHLNDLFLGQDANRKPSSARDYELLADLSLKQGKAKEAVAALKRVIEMDPDPPTSVRLYRKLAQAYLVLGQDDLARKLLDKVGELAKQKSPVAAVRVALAPQLIISASKALLDRVAAGKISFDEFRRSASVEERNFHREKKIIDKVQLSN